MGHGLTSSDTLFSVLKAPWHGVGVVLDREPASVAEALTLAGLDWTVRKDPVFQQRPDRPGGFVAIPDAFATVRADTGAVLGVVGERYRVAQNVEAVRFLDSLIGSDLHFETAGSLHAGRRVWALARLPKHINVGGDPTAMHVLVTNSHDGSSAVQAAVTPVRVVCQNTLTWGLSRAKRTNSIRHTEQLQTRLIEARRVLELTVDYAQQFKALGDELALAPFGERQLQKVLDELWPCGLGAEGRQEHRANDPAVALHRRRLALAVVLDVAQELRGGVGERRARADEARQGAAPRLLERFAQPVLGEALGEVAGGRTAPARPRRAAPSIFWTCRSEPVRYFAYQTGPRLRSTRKTCPEGRTALSNAGIRALILAPSRDVLGTRYAFVSESRREETAAFGAISPSRRADSNR